MASKARAQANLLGADGKIKATQFGTGSITSDFLDSDAVSPAAISNKDNTSTGYFDLPAGTTAQRPGSPTSGNTRFNTDTGSLEFYDGTGWISTNLIPTVDSVTGTIYAGAASNLTVSVSNATDSVTVRFSEGGSIVADVTDVDMSTGSASVAVPAAVYGQSAGDTIAVSVINQDGTPSSNAITKTVQGVPTGGTITTSGGYRYHTFTTSSSLVVPSGFSATAEYLVVAGGGGGGAGRASASWWAGGGGGAGGAIDSSTTLSAQTYTITVGAGGNGQTAGSNHQSASGVNGNNSTAFGQTAIGGGAGGSYIDGSVTNGRSGGSGGGAGATTTTGSGGSGTSGQGNAGGSGVTSGTGATGGGGGAGEAGGNASSSGTGVSGNGGAGINWKSLGTFYAGGGGGGASTAPGNSATPGTGGSGGGANGRTSVGDGANGFSGQVNTGGGGGGIGGNSSISNSGGAGGSGIVIVRYQL